MRSEEITAVAETIAIITEDSSQEQLSKTVSLIQFRMSAGMSTAARAMRSRAAAALQHVMYRPEFDDLLDAWRGRKATGDTPHMQLATLQVSVQLDSFTKVKEAMDSMVAELKEQQKEEVKLKEFCTTEFNENEKQTYQKTEKKEDLTEKIEGLEASVKTLSKEIEAAKEEIAKTELSIKKAGQTREEENAEYQTTVADQRATQVILKKALQRLEQFYKKKALLQEREDPVPPVQFKPMKKNAGGSPVIGLIEQIIEESKAVETEAVAGEKAAQADYEQAVKDSLALVKDLKDAVTEKTKAVAEAKDELVMAQTDLAATETELQDLNSYKADLHEQCDFILKNFDLRQKARMQEIEAINEAKGILSGAMS